MDTEVFDVVQEQAVAAHERVDRGAREVAEVLVIDRVELAVFDEVANVGVLDRDDPVVGDKGPHARDEAVEVGHVGHDVVRDDHVGPEPFRPEPLGQLDAEELAQRRDPLRLRGVGLIGRGVDAEHADPALGEVPEQVAVVAGDLHDEAVRTQPARLDEAERVRPRVVEQSGGERREVQVVLDEELLRWHLLEDLHERAARTERDVQRESRLRVVQTVLAHERIGQGRRAERKERPEAVRAAGSTGARVRHRPAPPTRRRPNATGRRAVLPPASGPRA